MRQARGLRVVIRFTSAWCMAAMCHGQEKFASPVPSRPQPAINRAAEALRREAETGIKERGNDFARLEALPPAAPSALPVIRGGLNRLALVPANGDAQDENAPPGPQFLVAHETFDLYVFGTTGDVESARDYMETLLTGKINVIDRMHRMTPVQKKKLLLAGRGDIKRLLDRVEDERKMFEHLRTDLPRLEEFLIRLQPLRLAIRRGPFGPESLFAKTFKKMRAEENLARREPSLEPRAPGR